MRILCVLLLVLPLLFPGPCAEGVRRGLALAAGSALPALFPFFVAGELLTVSHADRALSRLLAPLLRRVFALPQAGAAPVVLGLTGGYPVGAAACASLLREGRLSASDARREALFCSCASPGFCIALAGVTLFGSAKTGALLYGIQVVSALLTDERTNDTGISRTFRQQTVLRRILFGRASCGGGLARRHGLSRDLLGRAHAH